MLRRVLAEARPLAVKCHHPSASTPWHSYRTYHYKACDLVLASFSPMAYDMEGVLKHTIHCNDIHVSLRYPLVQKGSSTSSAPQIAGSSSPSANAGPVSVYLPSKKKGTKLLIIEVDWDKRHSSEHAMMEKHAAVFSEGVVVSFGLDEEELSKLRQRLKEFERAEGAPLAHLRPAMGALPLHNYKFRVTGIDGAPNVAEQSEYSSAQKGCHPQTAGAGVLSEKETEVLVAECLEEARLEQQQDEREDGEEEEEEWAREGSYVDNGTIVLEDNLPENKLPFVYSLREAVELDAVRQMLVPINMKVRKWQTHIREHGSIKYSLKQCRVTKAKLQQIAGYHATVYSRRPYVFWEPGFSHLRHVYNAAYEHFEVQDTNEEIRSHIDTITDSVSYMSEQKNHETMEYLELVIILLIAVEVVLYLGGLHA